MQVRYSDSIVGWSEEGNAALLKSSGGGPEGGYTLAYRFIAPARGIDKVWELSNTLSPGDGSEPEHISAPAYERMVKEMNVVLQKAGASNIIVKADPDHRERSVSVAKPLDVPSLHYASLADVSAATVIRDGAIALSPFSATETLPFKAIVAPDGQWMLIFAETRSTLSQLQSVFYIEKGKLSSFWSAGGK